MAEVCGATCIALSCSVNHRVELGVAHYILSGMKDIDDDQIKMDHYHTDLTLYYRIAGIMRLIWLAREYA